MKQKNKGHLGLWSALVSGLMLLVAVAAGSVSSPVKDAEQYSCTSSCINNYRYCITQGKDPYYCQAVYQSCMFNCGGGGGTAGAQQN